MSTIHENVQNYYAEQVQQSGDLKTDVCSAKEPVPSYIRETLQKIHPEVVSK